MPPIHESPQLKKALQVLLEEIPALWACYVYGSVASGDARKDSDVDIALLLSPGEGIPEPLRLTAKLAEVFGRRVDLVDLRQAGDILRKEVLANGIAFYAADPDQLLAWEAESMTDYAMHTERIRDILKDFDESGIGYAR